LHKLRVAQRPRELRRHTRVVEDAEPGLARAEVERRLPELRPPRPSRGAPAELLRAGLQASDRSLVLGPRSDRPEIRQAAADDRPPPDRQRDELLLQVALRL